MPSAKPSMSVPARKLLDDGIAALQITRRSCVVRFPSVQRWLEFFRHNFGPTLKAFEALDATDGELTQITDVVRRFNRW